ncbi:MAG: 30S ribosomal protein S6 [Candidatus Omnitrophota bacterium]
MINNYEAMFILQPNLSETQGKEAFAQLDEAIIKNEGQIVTSGIWSEKRKLGYPIRKFQEGLYYLITFKAKSSAILKLRQIYKLNENILRILITAAA